MKQFNSTVLILPGLGNSGEGHWQSLWEKRFPEFVRVNQQEWDAPNCANWIDAVNREIDKHEAANVILIGHSLGCATIVFWAQKFKIKIKGALLVAPSDTEAETYTFPTTGFAPLPLEKLPFSSILAAGIDDYYVKLERARQFAAAWGSDLVEIPNAGHINVATGYGEWEEGLNLLRKLDG